MQTTREIDSLGVLLHSQTCLIFDRSIEVRTDISRALVQWGVPAAKVFAADSCAEVDSVLSAHRPTLCIFDFDSEIAKMKTLLDRFSEMHPEMKRVAILLNSVGSTRLSSDGQADGHLEKPFAIAELRKILLKSMTEKFYPDTFMRKVLTADELAKSGQDEKAKTEYLAACAMNPNAQRAYRGLAFLELKAGKNAAALLYFKQARDCGSIDCKGLAAEFKTHYSLKDFVSASRLIPLLCAASPQDSESLKHFCDVALLAQNFEDRDVILKTYKG
jgi:tetratricopeptide (TPR) repeat protein